MGYRPKKKIYNLVFDDPEMEGLEVKIKGLNTGQMLSLDQATDDGGEEAILTMLALYAEQLIEWNVEDDDGPVSPTLEAIHEQDLDFNMAVINAWKAAVAGVPAPLESSSPDGVPSLEASIPMDVRSESLAS
ncbi:hypothetical protein ACFRLW_10480 [Streptomyces sp. NPDC056728]